jgi:hypothetical protein
MTAAAWSCDGNSAAARRSGTKSDDVRYAAANVPLKGIEIEIERR